MKPNHLNALVIRAGNPRAESTVFKFARAAVEWFVAAVVGASVTLSLTAPQTEAVWQGSIWREGSLILALALLVTLKFNLGRPWPFLVIFASWLCAIVISATVRFGQVDALSELIRHLYMIAVGALVYQACGSKSGRSIVRKFIWFVLAAVAAICLVSVADVVTGGWSWDEARVYKAVSLKERGVGFNSLLFIMVVALVSVGRTSKAVAWIWWLAFAIMLACCLLLATRAPLVSMIIAWAAVAAYGFRLRLGTRSPTQLGATVLAVVAVAAPLILLPLVLADPASPIARLGTGRIALWQISIAIWQESPIFGVGPNALMVGAQDFLNFGTFSADYERLSILTLGGGGFHNLWLDTLASKGIFGLLGLTLSYVVLLRMGLMRAGQLTAQPLLILLAVFLARSVVEVSGLFGYQNSPLDFVIMVALALTMRDALNPRGEPDLR